jgi:hypothetical protein
MSIEDIIGLSLAGILFTVALALPFIKSERERNTPGVGKSRPKEQA